MAINRMVFAMFFTLALASFAEPSAKQLKGSVTCLDCNAASDLSGIQILVKCDKVKKLSVTYTTEDGTFQTELPSENSESSNPLNCMAKIMGGPYQLFTPTKNSFSQIAESSRHFTTSTPLSFYKACPFKGKCGAKDVGFASSKTLDLPVQVEFGLAPTSYYYSPFVPIIGIP